MQSQDGILHKAQLPLYKVLRHACHLQQRLQVEASGQADVDVSLLASRGT